MKIILLSILIALLVTNSNFVFARPGNTASDGCHYCRTNCDKWGVPWNVRHCHGGYHDHSITSDHSHTLTNINVDQMPKPIDVERDRNSKVVKS